MLHFGGVLWSQVEHAAAASGMPRLHRGTERAAGVTAGVDEAGVVIEESTNNKSRSNFGIEKMYGSGSDYGQMGDLSPNCNCTRVEFDRYTANVFPIVLCLKYAEI